MAPNPDRSPLINYQLLHTQYEGNVEQVFARLAPIFCETTPDILSRLQSAFEHEDFESLWRTAHELYGNSATIGAERMATLSRQVEEHSRSGDFEMVSMFLPALLHESQRVLLDLNGRAF